MKKGWVYAFVFAIIIVASIILVSSINLDLNHDGVINITDLQILAAHFEGKAIYNSSFDWNGNGKVDLFDLVKVARDINVSSSGNGTASSVTYLSRDVSSTDGGETLNITGTGFSGTPTVLFGSTAAIGVSVFNSTLLSVTVPSHVTGTINVSVGGINGPGFEYLPAPTVIYASNDFDNGTLSPFTYYNTIPGGSLSIVTVPGGAVSGTKAVKCFAPGGYTGGEMLIYSYNSPKQPALEPTGVYERWYLRMGQTTLNTLQNGQIKLQLDRGGGGSWFVIGIGPDFPGKVGNIVVETDYNSGIPSDGSDTGFHVTANKWFEFETYFQRSNGMGHAKFWINGKLVQNVTNPNFGTDNATVGSQVWQFAIGYTQSTPSGANMTLYVDNAEAANGFIDN